MEMLGRIMPGVVAAGTTVMVFAPRVRMMNGVSIPQPRTHTPTSAMPPPPVNAPPPPSAPADRRNIADELGGADDVF